MDAFPELEEDFTVALWKLDVRLTVWFEELVGAVMAVRVQLAYFPEQSKELLWCLADVVDVTCGATFAVIIVQRSRTPIRLDFMLGLPVLAKERLPQA